MPSHAIVGGPGEPERLGGEGNDVLVEVHHHQHVALDPRLVANVIASRGRPPPAWEVPLPPERQKRPHRRRELKPDIPTHSQRRMLLDPCIIQEGHMKPGPLDTSRR
jgi:hypothetical protein